MIIKHVSYFLYAILMALLLTACGGGGEASTEEPQLDPSVVEDALLEGEPPAGEDLPEQSPPADAPLPEGAGAPSEVVGLELPLLDVETYGAALAEQVANGDGNGIDDTFRNSGVVIDESAGLYYAVNGVHPVNRGDYTSYYPKSIIAASLADDSIAQAYPFSEAFGHDVDMEGLTYGPTEGSLYIGDEYNYIYEMDIASGELLREWNLADIGISTDADRGIEALTYSPLTGYFYAGVQDSSSVVTLDLADDGTVTEINSFALPASGAPSGLFAHSDGTFYAVTIGADQQILRFDDTGALLCLITIPETLGMARPDGIYITADDSLVYLADSQGPLFGGSSMFRVAWNDPCSSDNAVPIDTSQIQQGNDERPEPPPGEGERPEPPDGAGPPPQGGPPPRPEDGG